MGPACYVNEPSTCTDVKEGTVVEVGKRYSWEACQGK